MSATSTVANINKMNLTTSNRKTLCVECEIFIISPVHFVCVFVDISFPVFTGIHSTKDLCYACLKAFVLNINEEKLDTWKCVTRKIGECVMKFINKSLHVKFRFMWDCIFLKIKY
jgi:hypothetical protein